MKPRTSGGGSDDGKRFIPGVMATHHVRSGMLYKKRAMVKGWRPRFFLLDSCFLHYYLAEGDPLPRKSLQIAGGEGGENITIIPLQPVKVGGVEYFPFKLTDTSNSIPIDYYLSTHSRADADAWISAILQVAKVHTHQLREVRNKIPEQAKEDDFVDIKLSLENEDLTFEGTPTQFKEKIQQAVRTILDYAQNSDDWEEMFVKQGIKASRKLHSGSEGICVRGEAFFPFAIADIFAMIINEDRKKDIDTQLSLFKKVKYFSTNTSIDYLLFKQVWPTAARDFCNLSHWCLLKNGTFVTVAFSENFDDLCPPTSGVVRGELIIGGYVLIPRESGTQIHYVVQSNLRGTIPSSITNLVASGQPMLLAKIKQMLESRSSKRPSVTRFSTTFEEIHSIIEKTRGLSLRASPTTSCENTTNCKDSPVVNDAPSSETQSTRKTSSFKIMELFLFLLMLAPLLYLAVAREMLTLASVSCCLLLASIVLLVFSKYRKLNIEADYGSIPSGRVLFRFGIELGKLLKYLESSNNQKVYADLTVTHLAVKALALSLLDFPELNGFVIGDHFVHHTSPGVDVSVSYELYDSKTVVLKVANANLTKLCDMSTELKSRIQQMRDGTEPVCTEKHRLLSGFRLLFFRFCGYFNLPFPVSQIDGCLPTPCLVITLPSKEAADHDIDLTVISNMTDSASPIIFTIGGVKLCPVINQDKVLSVKHMLSAAIVIDTRAGSISQMKNFVSKLQNLLNNPDSFSD